MDREDTFCAFVETVQSYTYGEEQAFKAEMKIEDLTQDSWHKILNKTCANAKNAFAHVFLLSCEGAWLGEEGFGGGVVGLVGDLVYELGTFHFAVLANYYDCAGIQAAEGAFCYLYAVCLAEV